MTALHGVQVPMVYLTEWMRRKSQSPLVGNLVFWLSFCVIGQPLAVMLYWTLFTENRTAQRGLVSAS